MKKFFIVVSATLMVWGIYGIIVTTKYIIDDIRYLKAVERSKQWIKG